MRTPTSPPQPPRPGSPPAQPNDQVPSAGPPAPAPAEEVTATPAGGLQAERRAAAYRDADGALVEQQHEVVEDPPQRQANLSYAVTTLVSVLFGALEVILLLRLLFRLLGANQANSFVSWLYSVSQPFVAPFNGIFNDQSLSSQGVFEASTLIAVLIYALLAWLVVWLLRAALVPRSASRERLLSTRRRQL